MPEETKLEDPVKIQTTNHETGDVTIHPHLYEREMLEMWIDHQVKEVGTDVLSWKIIEII